jgi:hypothetical protein
MAPAGMRAHNGGKYPAEEPAMARTDNFRKQHEEILALTRKVMDVLEGHIGPDSANQTRTLLSLLSGKVSLHLAMEDRSFYPALLASRDSELRELAEEYIDEMGLLAITFGDYLKKWSNAAAIVSNEAAFRSETLAIVSALGQRIARENRQLYEMVDAM